MTTAPTYDHNGMTAADRANLQAFKKPHANAPWAAKAKVFCKLKEYAALVDRHTELSRLFFTPPTSELERRLLIDALKLVGKQLNSTSRSIDYWVGIMSGKNRMTTRLRMT